MYSIVKIELIDKFLLYYNIDYFSLSVDCQALIVILSNILVVLFFFVATYFLYRILCKFWDYLTSWL